MLIRDRFEAYIDWTQFEENQQKLRENSSKSRFQAAPGRGVSLLAGLLQCGRCGRSMSVGYSSRRLRYSCCRGAIDYGEPTCQSLSGNSLDDNIARLLLEALQPASFALSLQAGDDIRRERKRAADDWQHRLARSAYECERTRRQRRRAGCAGHLVELVLRPAQPALHLSSNPDAVSDDSAP